MRDNAKTLSLKIANNIKSYSFDKARKENEKLYILLSSLYDVIEKFDKCYSEEKAKRKVITFNDCEHICLEILKNKDINGEIKENYDYVYIDEYQDISMLQEEILRLISKEDNMFMVGDIKQSIYRFRLAEPDIFNNKYELYKREKQKLN
jgi:ATP-dependent helicase/nuclease subunit A